jgi:heat shock protein HslJ
MRLSTGRGPRRALSIAFLAAVAAVVVACTGGGAATAAPSESAAGSASAAASAGALELDGTSWLLTDYVSPDGAVFTVPAAVTPLLAFEGGNLTGNAGCNTFSSTYTVTGDVIEIGPIMSTKMACEEPMASVEGAYLAALESIDKVAILDDGKLQLWDDGGKTTLAFLKGS